MNLGRTLDPDRASTSSIRPKRPGKANLLETVPEIDAKLKKQGRRNQETSCLGVALPGWEHER